MKKSMLRWVFCTCVFMWSHIAHSQDLRTINGTVTDSSGTPLSGASVLLKGGKSLGSTDSLGKFSVSLPVGQNVLTVSLVGYASKDVEVKDGAELNVVLAANISQGEAVVVTALGIKRQTRGLVYATQDVKASELTQVSDGNNVMNSLQGKVAGLNVSQGSGGPGSGSRIVLRGNRSIQGTNNALLVIDGVPILNPTATTGTGDFGSITTPDGSALLQPNDIESMTVLKGASAAALYGSQAGNGVILVNTKSGRSSGLKVDFNSGLVTERPFSLPFVQNEYGQGSAGVLDASAGASWGAKMEGQSYTNYLGESDTYSAQKNNIKDFFRTGLTATNYVGISGGNDKTTAYFSYNNQAVQGIIRRNNLMNNMVDLRIMHHVTDKLSIDAKVNYSNMHVGGLPRTGEENAPVMDIYQIPRNVSTALAKRYAVNDSATDWPSTLSSIYQNPYWMVNNTDITYRRDRIAGFISANYKITDWLNITGRANIDRMIDNMEQKYMAGTILYAAEGTGGEYDLTDYKYTQQWYDAMLTGHNNIGADFKINYNAGAIFRDYKYSSNALESNGLNVRNKFSMAYATSLTTTPGSGGNQTQSVFGTANLSYKNVAYLDASVRNDWDSRLPDPYSFTYYSVGGTFILSDIFQLDKGVLSFLKAGINYAQVGNGGQEQIRTLTYSYSTGAGSGSITRSTTYPIADLKPEIVKNLEGNVEARFFNNRLTLNASVYKSNSLNQLISLSLPAATGYSSEYINAGNIQNSGFELVLGGTPIQTNNFTWNTTVNFSANKSKVKALTDGVTSIVLGQSTIRGAEVVVNTGGRYGDLYGYTWARDASGNLEVSDAGIPVQSSTVSYLGNFNPDALLGWSNNFQYKNFSLRVLADGRIGGTMISGTEGNLAFSGITKATTAYRDGGLNINGVSVNTGSVVSQEITAQDFWQSAGVSSQRYITGELFAYNTTSFRLRELAFSYDIPMSNSVVKSLSVGVVGRNLFWLYRGSSKFDIPGIGKRKMWFDPDMSLGNGNYQGVEYGTMPSTRSIGINVKASF
ncbi:MAG: SusC/RagA family TonB-linked outer membrane protein [Chitinophagaceae bacterium]